MRNRGPAKLYYSVRELASLAGVSKYEMRTLLVSNGVPIGATGRQRKGVVFVSSLTQALPELTDSLRMFRGLAGDDE